MGLRSSRILALLPALAVVSCLPGNQHFDVVATPAHAQLRSGQALPVSLRITRLPGFQEDIEVSLTDAPEGIHADPVTLPSAVETAALMARVEVNVEPGDYVFTLEAISGAERLQRQLAVSVSDFAPLVREQATVLSHDAGVELLSCAPDTLVFAAGDALIPSFEPGQILVSDSAPAAPYGFLRKIQSTERDTNGRTVIHTVPALLGEAMTQGSWHLNRALTPRDVSSVQPMHAGVHFDPAQQNNGDFLVELDVSQGGLHFKGSIDLAVFLSVGASSGGNGSAGAVAVAAWKESLRLHVSGHAQGQTQVAIPLLDLVLKPFSVTAGIPLVMTPHLVLALSATGNLSGDMEWTAQATFDAAAGIGYDGTPHSLQRFAAPQLEIAPTAITGAVHLELATLASATIQLYDMAGPSVRVGSALTLDGRVPQRPAWTLVPTLEASSSLRFPPLGVDVTQPVHREMWLPISAPDEPPAVALVQPADGSSASYRTGTFAFQARIVDPEEGESCCTVVWTSDRDGILGTGRSLAYAFPSPGARLVTVTATDADGLSASSAVHVVATNARPSVTLIRPLATTRVFRGVPLLLQASIVDVDEPGGDLCNNVTWSTDLTSDPKLSGCNAMATFTSTGPRTLTLFGTDSFGAWDFRTLTLNVE